MNNTLHVQTTNIQKQSDDIARIYNMLDQKDIKIENVERIMDGRADDLKKQFTKCFKTLSTESKSQQEEVNKLSVQVEKVRDSNK